MKRLFAVALLLLVGCCSREDLRIYSTSYTGIDIYDPRTDTIYKYSQDDDHKWMMTGKLEHWSRWRD